MRPNYSIRYIRQDGRPTTEFMALFPEVRTFADNAAAVAGGLTVGDIYATATGELRIVV